MSVETRVDQKRGCGWRSPGGTYLVSAALSEPCPLLPYETSTCPTCNHGIRPARGFTWVDGATLIPPTVHGTPDHSFGCPLAPVYVNDDGRWAPTSVSRIGRCGLLWIGETHYPTPAAFMREASAQGVSRRITAVPKGFVAGRTWILLGHRKAIERACSRCGDFAFSLVEDTIPRSNQAAVDVLGMADLPDGLREAAADALARGPARNCSKCGGTGYEHRPGVVTAFQPTAIEYVTRGDESAEEIEALERRGITPVRVERAPSPQGSIT